MARPNQKKKPVPRTIAQAMELWISNIQDTLTNLNNPTVPANQKEGLKAHLKSVVNEAITQIQANLLLENSLLASDPYGFTKGKTAWGSEASKKANPYSYLVDQYCNEILEQQKLDAEKAGSVVDTQSILNAKEQAEDDSADKIELKSVNADKGKGCTIEVDKKSGDATVYQMNPDGSKTKVSFIVRWWNKAVDFVCFIFSWLKDKCIAGWNYLTSKFRSKDGVQTA